MIERLLSQLSIGKYAVPRYTNQDLITIKCRCEFEPFQKASEDWEIIWTLTLNIIPYYWKSTSGWIRGKAVGNLNVMRFDGRTLEECIGKAEQFLHDAQLVLINDGVLK